MTILSSFLVFFVSELPLWFPKNTQSSACLFWGTAHLNLIRLKFLIWEMFDFNRVRTLGCMSWSSHIFKVLHRNSTLLPQLSYLLNHFEIYLTLISENLLRELARWLGQNVAMHFFKLPKPFQILFRALHKIFLSTNFLLLSKVALILIIIWFSS